VDEKGERRKREERKPCVKVEIDMEVDRTQPEKQGREALKVVCPKSEAAHVLTLCSVQVCV